MVLVDVLVVLLLVAAVLAGALRGFVASVGTLAGLAAGTAAALWVAPLAAGLVTEPVLRAAVVPACWAALLVLGAVLGGAVGAWVRRGVDRTPLKVIDRIAGGAAAVVVTALAVSLAGGAIVATGIPGASAAVASSRALAVIDTMIPPPVRTAIAQVRSSVVDDAQPVLDVLLPGAAAPTAPAVPADDPEIAQAAASVARISGVAFACGASLTGSGFAVAADAVVTNAHVVAGVTRPLVQLPGRPAQEGRIVYFDPTQDLAVVRVDGMGAVPLVLSAPLHPGAAAVVAGYPFGGPLTTADAHVLSSRPTTVEDIYGETTAVRPLYALEATVHPGNSGGPLLTGDGTVAGVVFARDENRPDRGYAIADTALAPVLSAVPTLTAPVDSGRCTQ